MFKKFKQFLAEETLDYSKRLEEVLKNDDPRQKAEWLLNLRHEFVDNFETIQKTQRPGMRSILTDAVMLGAGTLFILANGWTGIGIFLPLGASGVVVGASNLLKDTGKMMGTAAPNGDFYRAITDKIDSELAAIDSPYPRLITDTSYVQQNPERVLKDDLFARFNDASEDRRAGIEARYAEMKSSARKLLGRPEPKLLEA